VRQNAISSTAGPRTVLYGTTGTSTMGGQCYVVAGLDFAL
jgi:hypothetical protein